MLTTTILGEAIGVQHGGIQDRTSSNTVQGITHGLIIGKFKRGRTDQPMRINKDTIKARLGYEPNNPFYQVVQDCVDRFTSVWVLRVGDEGGSGIGGNEGSGSISCEGATNSATLIMLENPDFMIRPTGMTFEVNGVKETFPMRSEGIDMNAFHAKFPNLELGSLDESVKNNSTTEHLRVRFQGYPPEQDGLVGLSFTDNPTGGSSNGWATVCLAPAEPELSQYVLTIDDKGLVPSDGIYSGTITPPLPSASLSFNIQQYLPNGSNGRIFNVYSDAQGLVVSPNGATWEIDRANLASWFDDFPTESDFTGTGTYQFTIIKMLGDENIVSGELTYIVDSTIPCQPSILALPTGDFPDRLPDGDQWTFTYRINGGAIQTHLENAFNVPMDTVLVNFLGYYGLFSNLVSNGGSDAPKSRAFLAKYGHSIMGGSATDPDKTSIQSNTIELLVNPAAPHDAVTLMFGQSVTLHSCALVDWTKKEF